MICRECACAPHNVSCPREQVPQQAAQCSAARSSHGRCPQSWGSRCPASGPGGARCVTSARPPPQHPAQRVQTGWPRRLSMLQQLSERTVQTFAAERNQPQPPLTPHPSTPPPRLTPMVAVMSSSFSPLPSRRPTVRLRDRSPVQAAWGRRGRQGWFSTTLHGRVVNFRQVTDLPAGKHPQHRHVCAPGLPLHQPHSARCRRHPTGLPASAGWHPGSL